MPMFDPAIFDILIFDTQGVAVPLKARVVPAFIHSVTSNVFLHSTNSNAFIHTDKVNVTTG